MEETEEAHMEMNFGTERNREEMKLYPAPLHTHEEMTRNREAFMDSLRQFHASICTKFMVPVIGGKDLDLHLLYVEVTRRGGLERVIGEKKWREVKDEFKFPSTTTSASYVLRRYYLSLLYHFEQVYFFGVQGPLVRPSKSLETKTPQSKLNNGGLVTYNSTRKENSSEPQNGGSRNFNVTGSIDGKFEHGYLVTINLNNETLRGVLYHIPDQQYINKVNPLQSNIGDVAQMGRRRKRRRKNKDPSRPKTNRSAYNFFFAETHSKLREMFPHREREYSKMIGESWNKLTQEERTVYHDYGVKDKERYKREMQEYKERSKLTQHSDVNAGTVNNIVLQSQDTSQENSNN